MKKSFSLGLAVSAALFGALLGGCAPNRDGEPATAQSQQSILIGSTPASGSTVAAPVNELMLHFSPPATLNEVTVNGPDGTMPMMLTPAGESDHYSLPLSGLGPGSYTVNWRASAAGAEHHGSFSFTVR